MEHPLVLVANPGSASRKYALYHYGHVRGSLHFEYVDGLVVCNLEQSGQTKKIDIDLTDINTATAEVSRLLQENNLLHHGESIEWIGLRIVAPGSYFLQDRVIDDEMVSRLQDLSHRSSLHINVALSELQQLRQQFPNSMIVGVSDSAFHITKPACAWNYGINIDDADRLDIKRFGYHGISAASIVDILQVANKLPPKVIIAHLGSGASITAIKNGKSMDTTMGYSPLEGVTMSTRSGTIDLIATQALKNGLNFDDTQLSEYLNKSCGLLGLGGSDDIRELLQRESVGDKKAELALQTYTYNICKAIGQMAATLGGVDMLVFTGTVGERSAPIRERITDHLHYLDLILDKSLNQQCVSPAKLAMINLASQSKPVCVIIANEANQIATRTLAI